MKKVILFVLLIAVITGCSRKNGIYPVESGWDIIYDSHEYRYRCEPDGFYLYTDHGDKELYTAVFFHKLPNKEGRFQTSDDDLYIGLRFICTDEKGQYVYRADYSAFDHRFYKIQMVSFSINDSIGFCAMSDDVKPQMEIIQNYIKRQ